jgi:hypothetical protein
MASPDLHGLFQIGVDILNTIRSAATKAILARTGDAVSETTDSDNVEWWQHVGFISRPPKPDPGKSACQGVVIRRGDHDVCIASKDLRGLDLAGNLEDGETCVYAPGANGTAQGRILLKANGSVAIYALKGNTSAGTSVTIQCNADGTINLASEYGAVALTSSGIQIGTANGAGIELNASGVSLLGATVLVNGGSVVLGNSSATPLAHAIPTLAAITALQVEIATAAVTAAAVVLAVQAPLIPTTSVQGT